MLYLTVLFVGLVLAFGQNNNPKHQVEVLDDRNELAEGPYWDAEVQRLYWVDMRNMLVKSYSPGTGNIFRAKIVSEKKPVTMVIRVKDTKDRFVVALKGTLALIQWDGISDAEVKPVHLLDVVEDPTSASRCNDGKVDPSNRLWVGTMGAQTVSDPKGNEFEKDKGELYRIDFDGNTVKKTKMVDSMQIPNGLDWSLDKGSFYLVDSLTFNVTKYQYSDKEGTIKKLETIFDLKANNIVGAPNSLPDGMTIDKEGFLWIAVYGTGKVIRINPKTREKVFEMQLDKVLQPTSVCFGGRDLDTLYVTSAHVDWTDEFEGRYPQSGKLFKVTNLNVVGAGPSRPVRIPTALLEAPFNTNDQDATSTNKQ